LFYVGTFFLALCFGTRSGDSDDCFSPTLWYWFIAPACFLHPREFDTFFFPPGPRIPLFPTRSSAWVASDFPPAISALHLWVGVFSIQGTYLRRASHCLFRIICFFFSSWFLFVPRKRSPPRTLSPTLPSISLQSFFLVFPLNTETLDVFEAPSFFLSFPDRESFFYTARSVFFRSWVPLFSSEALPSKALFPLRRNRTLFRSEG